MFTKLFPIENPTFREKTTPSVCRHTDTPPGEENIPLYNIESDKVVWWNLTQISLINTERNKTTLSKIRKADLSKTYLKKEKPCIPLPPKEF